MIEAQLKHPELYAFAEQICKAKNTTMLAMRNSIYIGDIAVKNGVITSLYKRNGHHIKNAIAEVTNTTREYCERVIQHGKEEA